MPSTVDGYFILFPRTKIDSSDISSFYHPLAKGWVQSQLAPAFTVPFTDTNITYEQLTYYKIQHMVLLRTRDPDDSNEIGEELTGWIDNLLSGSAAMMLDDDTAIYSSNANATDREIISSNTKGFHSIFDVGSPFTETVDIDRLQEIENDKR